MADWGPIEVLNKPDGLGHLADLPLAMKSNDETASIISKIVGKDGSFRDGDKSLLTYQSEKLSMQAGDMHLRNFYAKELLSELSLGDLTEEGLEERIRYLYLEIDRRAVDMQYVDLAKALTQQYDPEHPGPGVSDGRGSLKEQLIQYELLSTAHNRMRREPGLSLKECMSDLQKEAKRREVGSKSLLTRASTAINSHIDTPLPM